jgi:hypothetical protein
MLSLWLIAAVLSAAGLLLAWHGWRGTRVNDHPICRRCGFDLVGRVLSGPERNICPECGADLMVHKAVQQGQRERRRWTIAAGCLLLAVGLGLAGLKTIDRLANFNWNTVKPVWLLVYEAKQPGFQNDLVLQELMDRRSKGELPGTVYSELAEHALAVQADPSAPWTPLWGDLILDAHERGNLPPERLDEYFTNAVEVKMNIRPRVRAGMSVPYSVTGRTTRTATKPPRSFKLTLGEVKLRGPSGEEVKLPRHAGSFERWGGGPPNFQSNIWLGKEPLTPGPWQVEVLFRLTIDSLDRDLPHMQTIEVVEGPSTRLVEAPGCTVTLSNVRAQLEPIMPNLGNPSPHREQARRLRLNLFPRRVDRPASFACFGRWLDADGGEREWPLGSVVLRPNVGVGWSAYLPEDFAAEEMTLILRPDTEGAESTPDLVEVPDIPEIVVPKVKVEQWGGQGGR